MLERLDEDFVGGADVVDGVPPIAKMRERAREHCEASTSGLRILFSNRESVPLEVALKGRIVTPLQVKAFDFGGAEVDWRGQTFLFTLPPGESVTLFFEGRVFGELLVDVALQGAKEGPGSLRRTVNLDLLERPWVVTLSGDRWIDGASSDLGRATVVRVAIEGSRVRFRREFRGISQELHQRLRNLGCVQ